MKKILLFMVCLTFFAVSAKTKSLRKESNDESVKILFKALKLIKHNYVDSNKVSYDKLMKAALRGIMSELDKYSRIEESKLMQTTIEETLGLFAGIGVRLNKEGENIVIFAPLEDSPAYAAGIKTGDCIKKVNGISVSVNDFKNSIDMLKGKVGTKVKFTIFRPEEEITKEIEIERAIIKVSSIMGSKIFKDNIGYIKISDFSDSTFSDLKKTIVDLKAQNSEGLVLDLRWNPGGLLTSAIKVSNLFLKKDKTIVSVRGSNYISTVYKTKKDGEFLDIPMLIMVNNLTASAAEIITTALKENKRALIFGEKTYGKGSIQTYVSLSYDLALRFTVAKYYSPDERVIDKKGVTPDLSFSDREKELTKKLYIQSSRYPGIIKPKAEGGIEDIQLKRAIDTLKCIVLFKD